MENRAQDLFNPQIDPLDKRLLEVAFRSRKRRRGLKVLPHETTPNIKIDPNDVNPRELFVMISEGIERYFTIPGRSAANKILANTSYLADYLVDSLSGNNEAVSFVTDGIKYLEASNEDLADAVKLILTDSKKREAERDAFQRKWQKSQNSIR